MSPLTICASQDLAMSILAPATGTLATSSRDSCNLHHAVPVLPRFDGTQGSARQSQTHRCAVHILRNTEQQLFTRGEMHARPLSPATLQNTSSPALSKPGKPRACSKWPPIVTAYIEDVIET